MMPRKDSQCRRDDIEKRQGAYLPHWRAEGATYSVTFRLADSLPHAVLRSLERERAASICAVRAAGRTLTPAEHERLDWLFSRRVEEYLNSGYGACWMNDERIAAIVCGAMGYFEGQRYDIFAWCVMPNHVHVVVRPFMDWALSDILHSWKSFTANRINALVGRAGPLWQTESFDHLIRDEDDYARAVQYVLRNPASAGLKAWRWVGKNACVQAAQSGPAEHCA